MSLIKGRKAICEYIGEDNNRFKRLYHEMKLPAWRTGDSGRWKARARDLDKWIDRQADECLCNLL